MVSWDAAKRRANLAKHGMDFGDAVRFDFETAIVDEDRDARGEQRFRAIGFIDDRLCFLVYAEHEDDIRVISLRPATRKERRTYEEKAGQDLHARGGRTP
jgi:uncharacterized DUF497 family protein